MSVLAGTTTTLTAEFLASLGGSLVDVTGLTISITFSAAGDTLAATSSGIVHNSTGLYTYAWAVPSTLAAGDYLVTWVGTHSAQAITATEVITVVTPASGTWASVDDVLAITNTTVTSNQLTAANVVVEMHAGRTYSVASAKTGSTDLEWMRRAVAYQAAWQAGQPDLLTRLDFEAVGGQRSPTPITETAMTLAPLARMALSRVSWLKSRSLHVRAPFVDGLGPINSDPTSSENDPYELWSPMGGGY